MRGLLGLAILLMACGGAVDPVRSEAGAHQAGNQMQLHWSVRAEDGSEYTQLSEVDDDSEARVNLLLGNAENRLTEAVFREALSRLLERDTNGDVIVAQQGQGKALSRHGYTEVVRSLSKTRLKYLGRCHEMRKLYTDYKDDDGDIDADMQAKWRAYDVRMPEPLDKLHDAVLSQGYFSVDLGARQAQIYIFQESSNPSGDELTEIVIRCHFDKSF